MTYLVNPTAFQGAFTLPAPIADKHLKLATDKQLKVIIYIFRHIAETPTAEEIAAYFRMSENEVNDSLCYWINAGVLLGKDTPINNTEKTEAAKKPKKAVRADIVKPSREDVGKRAAENEKFRYLLSEAQIKFGRLLKNNEASTLLWLFEDEGMEVSLILMLIEYALSENKCNLGFIERTAAEWVSNGVTTIAEAEKYVAATYKKKTAWHVVEKAFGIDDRLPSTKELENSDKWINEWGLKEDILRLAYEICVDAKSKFNMQYVSKILDTWHGKGCKTAEDAKALDQKDKTHKKNTKADYATYNIDLVEQMLNKGYGEN